MDDFAPYQKAYAEAMEAHLSGANAGDVRDILERQQVPSQVTVAMLEQLSTLYPRTQSPINAEIDALANIPSAKLITPHLLHQAARLARNRESAKSIQNMLVQQRVTEADAKIVAEELVQGRQTRHRKDARAEIIFSGGCLVVLFVAGAALLFFTQTTPDQRLLMLGAFGVLVVFWLIRSVVRFALA